MKQCEFDNVDKVKNSETHLIVNRFCGEKVKNKSIEWLLKNRPQ